MLCLLLVGVFTMAYNGLGCRLMFRQKTVSLLFIQPSLSNICSCFKNIIRELGKTQKSALIMPSEFRKEELLLMQIIPYSSHVKT